MSEFRSRRALGVGAAVATVAVGGVAGVHALVQDGAGLVPLWTLVASGAAFAAYGSATLRMAGALRRWEIGAFVVGSILFPVWAVPLGVATCVAGLFGVPHALFTAAYLWSRTESWIVAASSAAGLLTGVGLAQLCTAGGSDSEFVGWIAVGWHATVATALVWWAWSDLRWRERSRRWRTHCHGCGYPRAGLVADVCPECGALMTSVSLPGMAP